MILKDGDLIQHEKEIAFTKKSNPTLSLKRWRRLRLIDMSKLLRFKRKIIVLFYKTKLERNKYLRRKKNRNYIKWEGGNTIRFNNIKFTNNTLNELN